MDVLVVDDSQANLKLVRYILEETGMTVHCAESGEEALLEMKKRSFRLMITDRNMPGMDGFELVRKARKIAPQMPIIMFTGAMTPEIPQLALETGIAKVLAKPFKPDEMLETVRSVMEKRRKCSLLTESTNYTP